MLIDARKAREPFKKLAKYFQVLMADNRNVGGQVKVSKTEKKF